MNIINPLKISGSEIPEKVPTSVGIRFDQIAALHSRHGITAWLIFLLVALLTLPSFAYAANATKNVLVLGDSLSAGYGMPVEKGWVNLLQLELQRTHSKYIMVNASISGETTIGGLRRLNKLLKQHRPVIVVVELGANDGLRGYSIQSIEANLAEIIKQSKQAQATVLLVGIKLPPNYGEPYTTQFQNIYTHLAEKYRVNLLPFLLEGVPPEQFLPDNLHPSAEAQPLIMRTVMRAIKLLPNQRSEIPFGAE